MNLCYKTKPISCVEYHCLVVAEQRAVLRPGPPQQEAGRGGHAGRHRTDLHQ